MDTGMSTWKQLIKKEHIGLFKKQIKIKSKNKNENENEMENESENEIDKKKEIQEEKGKTNQAFQKLLYSQAVKRNIPISKRTDTDAKQALPKLSHLDKISKEDHNKQLKSSKQKSVKLFEDEPEIIRRQLQFNAVALYSTTQQRIADAMCRVLLQCGVPVNTCILNATACVGGDTLSFARHFSHVIAIEKDATRFQHLAHNMNVLRVSNVNVLHRDALDILFNKTTMSVLCVNNPVLVFVDPPWGGPDYKKIKKLSLNLSGQDLASIVNKLADDGVTQYVALKLPLNFDMGLFLKRCGFSKRNEQTVMGKERGSLSCTVVKSTKRDKHMLLWKKFRGMQLVLLALTKIDS